MKGAGPLGPYMAAADAVIGAAVLTVLGAAAGYWLDRKLHTTPLFSLVLVMVGMVLGLARMVIKAKQGSVPPVRPHSKDSTDNQDR